MSGEGKAGFESVCSARKRAVSFACYRLLVRRALTGTALAEQAAACRNIACVSAMSSVHVQHVDCVFLAWARQDAVRVSAQPQLGLSLEHCCGKREVVGGDQTLTAGVWRTDSPEPRVAKCISA